MASGLAGAPGIPGRFGILIALLLGRTLTRSRTTQPEEVALRGRKSHAVEAIDTDGSVIDEAFGWRGLSFDADVDHRSRS